MTWLGSQLRRVPTWVWALLVGLQGLTMFAASARIQKADSILSKVRDRPKTERLVEDIERFRRDNENQRFIAAAWGTVFLGLAIWRWRSGEVKRGGTEEVKKRLLWAACALALTASPAGLVVATWAYPDVPSRIPPWPAEPTQAEVVISGLIWAHSAGSVFAAVATGILLGAWLRDCGLTNESPVWVGIIATWLMIGVWWVLIYMWAVATLVEKTGKYL